MDDDWRPCLSASIPLGLFLSTTSQACKIISEDYFRVILPQEELPIILSYRLYQILILPGAFVTRGRYCIPSSKLIGSLNNSPKFWNCRKSFTYRLLFWQERCCTYNNELGLHLLFSQKFPRLMFQNYLSILSSWFFKGIYPQPWRSSCHLIKCRFSGVPLVSDVRTMPSVNR